MVKDTMKRKKPSFNESYHGYRTFSELLEDAAKQGLLELETDKRSRTYVVTRFGSEMSAAAPPTAAESGNGRKKKSRRRRGTKKKLQPAEAEAAPAVQEDAVATEEREEREEEQQPDLFGQGIMDDAPEREDEHDRSELAPESEPLAAEPEPRREPGGESEAP
jgi:hypothetical protein